MKPDRFEYVCNRLDSMNLVLPADPTEVGYDGLAKLISQARAYMSESEMYMREVLKNIHITSVMVNNKKSQYEIQSDSLLTERDIKQLPNILDRRAAVNQLLKPLIAEIAAHEAELFGYTSAKTIIRSKMNDLKGIIMDLKTMHRLLVDEKHAGSYYGSEYDASKDPIIPGKVSVVVPKPEVSIDELIADDNTDLESDQSAVGGSSTPEVVHENSVDISVLLSTPAPTVADPDTNKSDVFDIDDILTSSVRLPVPVSESDSNLTDDDNVLALLNQVQIPPKKDIVAADEYDLADLIGD